MKSLRFLSTLLAGGLLIGGLRAQDSSVAERIAIAERDQAEEFRRTTMTRLAELADGLQFSQKRLNELREEIARLRVEIDRLKSRNETAAMQENIKRLGEKIEEVDRKRQADNDKTLKALRELEKLLLERPAPRPVREPVTPPTRPSDPPPSAGGTETGYEYTIRDKDTLSGIVSALRTRGLKVTQQQIIDANPGLNPNKLKTGSKIFIPAPHH